jgi:hypothetical protein
MKIFAVNVVIIQSAESAEEARFNVNYALGEIIPPDDFQVLNVIETVEKFKEN